MITHAPGAPTLPNDLQPRITPPWPASAHRVHGDVGGGLGRPSSSIRPSGRRAARAEIRRGRPWASKSGWPASPYSPRSFSARATNVTPTVAAASSRWTLTIRIVGWDRAEVGVGPGRSSQARADRDQPAGPAAVLAVEVPVAEGARRRPGHVALAQFHVAGFQLRRPNGRAGRSRTARPRSRPRRLSMSSASTRSPRSSGAAFCSTARPARPWGLRSWKPATWNCARATWPWSGWARALCSAPDAYLSAGGVTAAGTCWLAERRPFAVGADNCAWDPIDAADPTSARSRATRS